MIVEALCRNLKSNIYRSRRSTQGIQKRHFVGVQLLSGLKLRHSKVSAPRVDYDVRTIHADGDFTELAVIDRNMRGVGGFVIGAHFFQSRPKRRPIVVGFGNGYAAGLLRHVTEPKK